MYLDSDAARLAALALPLHDRPLTLCDLTQSYAPLGGGGITTYLREKRDHVLAHTPHRLIQIVPGAEDRVTHDGRHSFVEIAAAPVRDSPNYRFILDTAKVRAVLAAEQPDVIESQCPWVLPWTAINHRRAYPHTTLVAGYHTDFPNAHVHRVARDLMGDWPARAFRALAWGYAKVTYRAFDWVYTLNAAAAAALAERDVARTTRLTLGVDTEMFCPARRDPGFRASLGLPGDGPLIVYAGRLDNEKRADRLIAMMHHLPPALGAAMVLVGDGKLRPVMEAAAAAHGLPVAFTGFEADRAQLARALASSDIYASAMADETFGISVIEAQASGLPIVGVAAGAMPDRVPPGTGLLGPVDDVAAMAANVVAIAREGPAEMGARGRELVAGRFAWRATFDRLFDEIYPAARIAAAQRRQRAAMPWFRPRDAMQSLPCGI